MHVKLKKIRFIAVFYRRMIFYIPRDDFLTPRVMQLFFIYYIHIHYVY